MACPVAARRTHADIFIRLGDAVIDNALPARLDGTESEARAGLSSDDIAIEVRSSWRFAHDILADYSAATRLLEPDGPDRLAGAPSPRRLIRGAAGHPARLRGCHRGPNLRGGVAHG